MLKRAKRLPRKFNRRVTPQTRAVVRRWHTPQKDHIIERLNRLYQRLKRRCVINRTWIIAGLIILLILSASALASVMLFSPALTVQQIRVIRSNTRVDIEQVQSALAEMFGRKLPFVSKAHVRLLLEEAVPDMATVHVQTEYPDTIIVRLELEEIDAKLRILDPDGNPLPTIGSGTRLGEDYITKEGMYVRYIPAQIGSGAALPTIDITDWGVRPSPWSILLKEDVLRTMRRAEVALADQFGQDVEKRTAFLRAQEFHLETRHFTLWFDHKSPLNEQLKRYRIFLEHVGLSGATSYIDLRIKDRVIYK